ncbi:hypothetical protein V5799_015123 [Amblyomma americanum]|uniref:Ig-like domain-containing protein n=1 Tax=Amblyomma americanum TaxID=6943 RepID=A0AAQ4E123_AMBAM
MRFNRKLCGLMIFNQGWLANEITVIKNQTGKLYCNVTLSTGGGSGDENPSQIRWYKGAELIYMLTSEGRNVPIRQMTHRPSASWRDRLQVRATRLPIWLSIDPVGLHDQGHYQCLVYYGTDVKRNVSHFLRVIEPPENVVIIFGTRPNEIRLSPNQKVRQNEGEDLYLECHVIGVKPVNVSIRNKDTPLKAGVLARVECESYGSRPAPQFSWWLDGKELVNNSRSVENDLSVLYFEPTVQNNGQKLTCISRNPLIRDSDCVDIWTLDVHYEPECMQGSDSYLSAAVDEMVRVPCRVAADPPQVSYSWSFRSSLDEMATRNLTAPRNGSGGLLFYQPKVAADFGTVYCWAQNDIGPMAKPCIFHVVLKELTATHRRKETVATKDSEDYFLPSSVCTQGRSL